MEFFFFFPSWVQGGSRLQSNLQNRCIDLDVADWHVSEPARSHPGWFLSGNCCLLQHLQKTKPDSGQKRQSPFFVFVLQHWRVLEGKDSVVSLGGDLWSWVTWGGLQHVRPKMSGCEQRWWYRMVPFPSVRPPHLGRVPTLLSFPGQLFRRGMQRGDELVRKHVGEIGACNISATARRGW